MVPIVCGVACGVASGCCAGTFSNPSSAIEDATKTRPRMCVVVFISPEKDRTRARAVNLYVTRRAARVLRILVVCWTSRLIRADAVVHTVTRQAESIHCTELQHSWISRPVRDVTRNAAIGFDGSVFERKWTLLVGVTLDTGGVSSDRQPRLF